MSLRRRLLLGLVAVAAVLVVTNVILSSTFESVLLTRVDRQLADVASRPIFRAEPGRGRGGPSEQEETLSEFFIAVGNPASSTLTQLNSAFADQNEPPPRLDRAKIVAHVAKEGARPAPFTAPATSGKNTWRLVAVTNRPLGGVTVVGTSLSNVTDTIARIRLIQIFGTAGVLATLGLVSFWMLRLGVHPLENMARSADAIAAGQLSRRVDHPSERTEAGRLGVAINSMLERIEIAFRDREASEEKVRRFAADASHELRTPLTSIRGYAELWRAGGLRAKQDLAEAMRRMEQEATRMGALVEDLLLLARLDQHRSIDRSPVRLDQIVSDAVHDARAVQPGRHIKLITEPAIVEGDELQLRQVIGNLLANARIHTPETATISVRVTCALGTAVLEVSDEGPGMAPEVAAKVFERFYRPDDSRARNAGGTGLGLSIVAAIAEAHGGRAAVDSTLGSGTRFVVELPATAVPGPPLAKASSDPSQL
jgi:two-component system OmpR family sensor kinase